MARYDLLIIISESAVQTWCRSDQQRNRMTWDHLYNPPVLISGLDTQILWAHLFSSLN